MPEKPIASSQCKDCRRVIVPPRETCPYCGMKAGTMESLELPSRGTVQSYTTLQTPPEGFQAPLSLALVELEHGAMILCLANELNQTTIKIGDEVEISTDFEGRFCFQKPP
jgi:uncharacterized OB-fold protein